jgi:hypothetical protein
MERLIIQFRSIALDPTPNGGMVGCQAPLSKKFLDIAVRKRKSQIPAYGAQVITAGSKCRHLNKAGRDLHSISSSGCRDLTSLATLPAEQAV